ncbi:MAG: LamG-like jellyroll fold domain-containing protein [Planctomycetota bacterium]
MRYLTISNNKKMGWSCGLKPAARLGNHFALLFSVILAACGVGSQKTLGFGECNLGFEVCFQGIGDLPGGMNYSDAKGIAYVDGVVVVVGESSSEATQDDLHCNGCREAVLFKGISIRPILTPETALKSLATDVALVGSTIFITGTSQGRAMRTEVNADEPVVPFLLPLSTEGGFPVVGNSISDDGQFIVGNTTVPNPEKGTTCFRWVASTNTTVLIPKLNPNGFSPTNRANGVAPDGFYSVGGSNSQAGFESFILPIPNAFCSINGCQPGGIGDLSGGNFFSEAFAVNNSGVAVGYGTTSAGQEAFRWTPGLTIPTSQLRSLGDFPGGATMSRALGISNNGVIVGFGTSSTGQVAFLWHPNLGLRGIQELMVDDYGAADTTGWTLFSANAISSNGLAIAGQGRNPEGNNEGWFFTLPDCNDNGQWDGLEAPAPFTETSRQVISLDGLNGHLEVPSPTTSLQISGALTVEAWVYLNQPGLMQAILTHGGRDSGITENLANNLLYSLVVDEGGDIRVVHERADLSDAVMTADTNLHTGLWYHIAVTRTIVSGSSVEYSVMVNDRAPITSMVSGLPAGGTSGRLRLGRGEGNFVIPTSFDRPLDGLVADVRIWNVVRSHDEIMQAMHASLPTDTTGLVALWPLETRSGNQVLDTVGSNPFSVVSSVSLVTVGADCNHNLIPDSCDVDCNGNGIPDDCDIRDATSTDCNGNGVPEECDLVDTFNDIFNPDERATEVFRELRDNPTTPVTFGTMIQLYGRPWKPGTNQKPGGGFCAGGSQDGASCLSGNDCPGGSCAPPPGAGATRDPAERLRIFANNRSCLKVGVAQRVFNEFHAFEMLLGNEAFADAMDPTVGDQAPDESFSLEQVPGMFAFRGLPGVPTLLEEELALLRGREISVPASASQPLNDEPAGNVNGNYPLFAGAVNRAAVYNRLRPNATDSTNGLGYRANFNEANNGLASEKFPQGHGDAYGHYLTAVKVYLDAFGADTDAPGEHDFAVEMIQSLSAPPGSVECSLRDCESILDDDGTMHQVDFQSVRNMAAAMAAKARTANRLVDLTFRRDYREETETRLADTDSARAWGTADWARRGGMGAYLDWAVVNHLLPVPEQDAKDEIEAVHRQRVDEIRILASTVDEMQDRVDAAGAGLNPLALVANVVPFRIIQPGQLLNFLEGGTSAGNSHYGIVRNAAVEAIKNARGILKLANRGTNRLRGHESEFTEFEEQVVQTELGLRDRLIEIFGLPSPSDTSDNDQEDNDGDGIQITGVLNDPEDDVIESGCDGECAGSPDLRNFLVDAEGLAELGWADRAAVGQVQLAMFELRTATLQGELAELALSNLEALIGDKAENLALVRNEAIETIEIRAQACGEQLQVIARKQELERLRQQAAFLGRLKGLVKSAVICIASEGVACGPAIQNGLSLAGEGLSNAFGGGPSDNQFDIAREELRINCWQTAELTQISNDQEIRKLEIELEDLIRKTPQAIKELLVAESQAQQALAVVQKNFQEGKRLVDDRDRIRRVQTDKLQNFRFRDMAFRTFRNQALEQYGAFFDLAGRYVLLAAKAFAYEYNEREEVSEQVQRLFRERLLGTESAGDEGLQSVIARLDQSRQESDFVGRLQKLSLFDHGGDEFSLRKNLLGLAINPSEDSDAQQFEKNKAFRAFLESNVVQNLLDVPAFRQFASLDSDRDSGPALVLTFSTEVAGRTLFGQRRGTTFGAPANFDTCSNPKLFEFAILLEGVDNPSALGVDSTLIFAHFLPVGTSMLRAPDTGDCALRAVRSWAVVDQRIPGVSAAYRDAGGAILDSFDIPRLATSADLDIINRFPVTQAQIRLTENPVFQDDLAGWSAWNTQWLLAIPGRQFADPNDDVSLVRRKLLILIFDANESGNPRSPDENLGIDDIKLRFKAYGKPS